jgi:hypothetical protein
MGCLLAFITGPVYGVWLEPFVQNPSHDASSIIALVGFSVIFAILAGGTLALFGWLVDVATGSRLRTHTADQKQRD